LEVRTNVCGHHPYSSAIRSYASRFGIRSPASISRYSPTLTPTIRGEFIVTLPQVGAVYLSAGTSLTAVADGTLEFQAGPGIVTEWFVNGGPMEVPSDLCEALGSA
jgi:hypothetical protein